MFTGRNGIILATNNRKKNLENCQIFRNETVYF